MHRLLMGRMHAPNQGVLSWEIARSSFASKSVSFSSRSWIRGKFLM